MCYLILSWSNKIVCNPAVLCVSAPSQNVMKSAANTPAPVLARSLNQKPLVTPDQSQGPGHSLGHAAPGSAGEKDASVALCQLTHTEGAHRLSLARSEARNKALDCRNGFSLVETLK